MQKRIDTKSWYRQFWPWLLFGLPACCLVAGLVTVRVASINADDMVVDSYYRDGKAINRRLDQDLRAAELELVAELGFNFDSGRLNLTLSGRELPSQLHLKLLHPMTASLDRAVPLESLGQGNYRGRLSERLQHRYHLRLLPGSGQQGDIPWRLDGEINFQLTTATVLSAQP